MFKFFSLFMSSIVYHEHFKRYEFRDGRGSYTPHYISWDAQVTFSQKKVHPQKIKYASRDGSKMLEAKIR